MSSLPSVLTWRINGGPAQEYEGAPGLDPYAAHMDLIMAQDLSGPDFTLEVWIGAGADTTTPPVYCHIHRGPIPPPEVAA